MRIDHATTEFTVKYFRLYQSGWLTIIPNGKKELGIGFYMEASIWKCQRQSFFLECSWMAWIFTWKMSSGTLKLWGSEQHIIRLMVHFHVHVYHFLDSQYSEFISYMKSRTWIYALVWKYLFFFYVKNDW